MLREKFWLHLEPTQTFDSWVVTVKERAAERKFPADFYEQAVRDKCTFSCKEDNYKLKLYDQGATLSLENAVKILSLKEATKRELQESKTAGIESVTQQGNKPDPKRRPFQTGSRNCGYCNGQNPPGKRNCPAAENRCNKCNKMGHFPVICRSTPVHMVNQVFETEVDFCPTFVGGVTTTPTPNPGTEVSSTDTVEVHQISTSDSGWHIKLKLQDQEYWHRCTSICDAQVRLQGVIWDAVKTRQRTC